MESASQVNVPLRSGGKKMRKRRELDALVAHSLAKRANKKTTAGNGVNSQDQLLSPSTDEQEDFGWPKVVRGSNRSRHRKFSFLRLCAPLVFVTCISLSLGFMYWLYFDLRQQLYEYRQKIEEVTVTSQNLPETLQKWHETSKNLEQNQTIIYGKIYELQHSLENLNGDFTQYKNKILNENKKDYSKDEKFVADFGAKIEAVTVDVENMKEEFSEFQKSQDNLKNDVNKLKSNFTDVVNGAASLTNNKTVNCSVEIENLKNQAFDKINSLSMNISTVNDVMNQKVKGLDEELIKHKKHLDELLDSSANTTSHVTSIEEDWTKYKEKFGQYEIFKNEMKSQVFELKNVTTDLDSAIRDVRSTCNKYYYDLLQNFEQLRSKKINNNNSQMNDKTSNEELNKNLSQQSSKNENEMSNAQSIVNLEKINNNTNYSLNNSINSNNNNTTNLKITTSTSKQITSM